MGSNQSRYDIEVEDQYSLELKNPRVLAAMNLLHINVENVGIRFYKVFAQMDIDGSHSIDLDEFHTYFGLPRTPLSDQVFSAMGHQSAERDVTFDDFVLNMWNFCTMSNEDLHKHIFDLYDEDNSGTLDSAECESLFRLLYHTNELSSKVRQIIIEVDAHSGGTLSFDEFFALCKRKKNVLDPIYLLQNKAQEKCLGKCFWNKEKKKRLKILAGRNDVFSLLKSLLENREQTEKNTSFRRSNSPTISDSEALPTNAFDREPLNKKQDKDKVATLEEWIKDQSNEPMVQQYFDAYVERFVTESHFNQTKCSDVELTAFLRHRMAVCEKRYTAAKANLSGLWADEERTQMFKKQESIRKMVQGVSTKSGGQENPFSTVNSYTQKKLDAASADITQEYKDRWTNLDKAATLLATRALATSPSPEMLLQEKKTSTNAKLPPLPTRVLPTMSPVIEQDEWT